MQENEGDLLIVDDLADNLRVLSNTLSNQGYRVRAVKSGAMALVGAAASPPDVILLDIRMPEMDGYEVCRRLKADPKTCDIPIIFLSALDEVEDKAKAFEAGGSDYITKPFQTEEVLARVKNQLTIQRLKGQVAKQQQQLEQMTERSSTADLENTDSTQNIGTQDTHAQNIGTQDTNMQEIGTRNISTRNIGTQNVILSAIATILDYSTRLCENPRIDPEQYAALKIIYQNGQTLLDLVNTQQEG